MSDLYHVSHSPHSISPYSVRKTMQDVVIALSPAALFGVYNFGLRALLIMLVSVTTCVLTEYLYMKARKQAITPSNFSEVVTGLLIAFALPVTVPLWIPILAGVFAIFVVKMLFGGIGKNIMNPALAARGFIIISFPAIMTNYAVEIIGSGKGFISKVQSGALALDAVSTVTPLASLRLGENIDLSRNFIGSINGTIGETSVIALLIGAGFLLYRKVISLRIPLTYMVSFSVFILIFGGQGMDVNFLMGHIMSGGLVLAVFFMATDYATSPMTELGQIIYGLILGVLSGVFRIFGVATEGVGFAIIISNLLTPLIERITVPRPFGKERFRHEK